VGSVRRPRALLGAGFTVYGTSRRAAAGETRGGVVFLPLDVTDDVSAAGAVREVLERSGTHRRPGQQRRRLVLWCALASLAGLQARGAPLIRRFALWS
jgi:NAD(P)-dependent dehydrogenase (short-subunit alcohol dehydrogenase family)